MLRNKLFLILIAALALRLSLIFVAYHGDLNNNISWGTLAVERGLNGLYGSPDANDWPYSAPNQPPLTILMFTGLGLVWRFINSSAWWLNNNFSFFPSGFIWFWERSGMTLLVKLPSLLADLGIGYLIYKHFVNEKREKLGRILASVWLFNPVTWYNSAIWGQTDSVVNFLGLISVWALLSKRLTKFVIFFVGSILFKGSLALFAPILLLVAVIQKYSLREWLSAAFGGVTVILVTSIWFHPYVDLPLWLVNLYRERILPGEIGYLTANAFNFWWLIDSGKTLDSTLYFGIGARFWGFVITSLGLIFALLHVNKKTSKERVFFVLAFVALTSFLFMTRIHERYLYPFFPYATLLLGYIPGFSFAYFVLSVVHILNLYSEFWAPPFPLLENIYNFPIFMQTLSLINIGVFVFLLRLLKSPKL